MEWKGDSPVMTEKTVSVELTESELQHAVDIMSLECGIKYRYPPCHVMTKLLESQRQLQSNRDREAKVQVMVEIVLPPASGIFASKRLDDLNAAGWDLVRMEDK
jgi:hypothetical protein